MKKITLLCILLSLLVLQCAETAEPLVCHVYGWVKKESDSTGVDGIILRLRDIDPYNTEQSRERLITTATIDSMPGSFEVDSICYGTSKMQGTGFVTIFLDSTSNPGWPNQYWHPDIYGAVDTVILYITQ